MMGENHGAARLLELRDFIGNGLKGNHGRSYSNW
jgi:hypothetical protein